jgi:hypothetical protein
MDGRWPPTGECSFTAARDAGPSARYPEEGSAGPDPWHIELLIALRFGSAVARRASNARPPTADFPSFCEVPLGADAALTESEHLKVTRGHRLEV